MVLTLLPEAHFRPPNPASDLFLLTSSLSPQSICALLGVLLLLFAPAKPLQARALLSSLVLNEVAAPLVNNTLLVNQIRKAVWAPSEEGRLSLRRMDSLLCLYGNVLVKCKFKQLKK